MSAAMDFDLQRAAILRMLIYPIQFDPDPVKGIDRVIAQVVFADHLRLSLPDVIAAIDAGLASDVKLSELIPQSHPEVVIRGFLSALRVRLETEAGRIQAH
jgi:hypothetical protein